jgi:hypothetical protein
MRYVPGHKEMLPAESRSTDRDILRNDRRREMEATGAERLSHYERRILILRSILWEVIQWYRTEGSEGEFKLILERAQKALDNTDFKGIDV